MADSKAKKKSMNVRQIRTVIPENLSTGKPEHTVFERNSKQSSLIRSITADSSCKPELDSTCHCEIAVQVKRIERDAKLLKLKAKWTYKYVML